MVYELGIFLLLRQLYTRTGNQPIKLNMSDKAVIVENLWKGYHLGGGKSGNLRESLSNLFFSSKKEKEIFWALQDINFSVNKGEAVGIIGRNGAGKSTLLKILSRITSPTKGRYEINGRVSSLLEVGTGFHPELTGRENIYMNGTILGMTRAEVKIKFDEIVAFSGIEKFIDTPVKRYSSGMYVRLAFAVAAHLEPEILIIDEVLAVGDAEFQKKCLGKMKDVSANKGRTVLFVSHNMGAVSQLCTKGIFLSDGKLMLQSDTESAIQAYINNIENSLITIRKDVIKTENHFVEAFMCNSDGNPISEYKHNEAIYISVVVHVTDLNQNYELAMRLVDRNKNPVFTIHEKLNKHYKNKNIVNLKIKIAADFLTPNAFSWVICINNPGISIFDLNEDVLGFSVLETGTEFARYEGANYGNVFAKYEIS